MFKNILIELIWNLKLNVQDKLKLNQGLINPPLVCINHSSFNKRRTMWPYLTIEVKLDENRFAPQNLSSDSKM